VWSISETSLTSGRPISAAASATTSGIGTSQRKCRKCETRNMSASRAAVIAAASTAASPPTSSTPSSRQTRSESSTVVMPQEASWPS
jgi:hypothetical protein